MRTEHLIALLLASLIGYLTYLIFFPFLIPIFWAVVLVIFFYPMYNWLLRKVTRRSSLASLLSCLLIAVFLILPMAFVGATLVKELLNLYDWAEQYAGNVSIDGQRSPFAVIQRLENFLGRYIDLPSIDLKGTLISTLKGAASFAGQGLRGFVTSLAQMVFYLVLVFFSMYFLFKEGDRALGLIKDLVPIPEDEKERMFLRSRDIISSSIYGGVLVALVQGALGGVAFWLLGLPAPILWGFVMFLFSILPVVGSPLIWIPAVVYLFISGAYIKALLLLVWGALIIGSVDNILKPIIISGKTAMHPLLLLFSILGAIKVFGFIGVIAGPLILSLALSIIEIYRENLKKRKRRETRP